MLALLLFLGEMVTREQLLRREQFLFHLLLANKKEEVKAVGFLLPAT